MTGGDGCDTSGERRKRGKRREVRGEMSEVSSEWCRVLEGQKWRSRPLSDILEHLSTKTQQVQDYCNGLRQDSIWKYFVN